MDSLLLAVRNMLDGQRSYSPGQVENYSLVTSIIYQQLFEPLIQRKKIIVIPDESLNLLPVEALVVKHHPEKKTYMNLAYLIYDHEITYAYSSSILFHKVISNENQPNCYGL